LYGHGDDNAAFVKAVQAVADSNVRPVVDGGYTDNTGIAHNVAAGSSEIISFLDLNAWNQLDGLFWLFQGGPPSATYAGLQFDYFQIFEETADYAMQRYIQSEVLDCPPSSFLTNITVTSLNATTVQNDWFGVTAGRSVELTVVGVWSPLTIGEFADFQNYNALLQEIVSCVTAEQNAGVVRDRVLFKLVDSSSVSARPVAAVTEQTPPPVFV